VALFLHQVHRIRGEHEDAFDAHQRAWMTALSSDDDARLLWCLHQAHGSGPAYRVVTISALRDAAAYGRLVERVAVGDLRAWARELDRLQHDSVGKLLVPLPWSPLGDVDLDGVPTDPDAEHDVALFMEDTGWPHAPLDDYTAFWGEVYRPLIDRSALLRIEACFQTAHGAGRRPEAILFQRVISEQGLLRLLTTETDPALRQPGTFMHDALRVRDQWESRLLRTTSWSPLA
jgi:hypothetical protein